MGTDPVRAVGKAFTILCVFGLLAIIAHKIFTDIAALSQQYSGGEFWTALARHFLWSLAGG